MGPSSAPRGCHRTLRYPTALRHQSTHRRPGHRNRLRRVVDGGTQEKGPTVPWGHRGTCPAVSGYAFLDLRGYNMPTSMSPAWASCGRKGQSGIERAPRYTLASRKRRPEVRLPRAVAHTRLSFRERDGGRSTKYDRIYRISRGRPLGPRRRPGVPQRDPSPGQERTQRGYRSFPQCIWWYPPVGGYCAEDAREREAWHADFANPTFCPELRGLEAGFRQRSCR